MKETIELEQISDSKLDIMLEQHRIWLVSNGERGERADFTLCDLGKRDLRHKCFKQAICKATRFDYSDLRDSDFNAADLDCAEFQYSDLRGASFCGANLIFTNFNKAKKDEKMLDSLDHANMESVIINLP